MADENKAPALDFGALIAFVAPGFVGLFAIAYQLPSVDKLVADASNAEQNVGVFLFGLLASLSVGLGVSGLRSLFVDIAFDFLLEKTGDGVKNSKIQWKSFELSSLTKLLMLRDNYYRYYQFYSNMAVAMILWAVSRKLSASPDVPQLSGLQWFLIWIGVVLMLLAAGRQLREYYQAKKVLTEV
jgi:hypothetical protein